MESRLFDRHSAVYHCRWTISAFVDGWFRLNGRQAPVPSEGLPVKVVTRSWTQRFRGRDTAKRRGVIIVTLKTRDFADVDG